VVGVLELTADLFVTLDGWAAGTQSPAYFGFDGPELERWILAELGKPQLLVMGRRTYEMLAAISQQATDEASVRMNELPKVVLSRTLADPLDWNARVGTDVRALKDGHGDPLRTIGSVSLVKDLLAAKLVDRLRLVVFPLILGATGAESVFAGLPDVDLELIRTETLDGRLLVLEYRPAD
jgi:dihydrofolate reductase